MFMLIYQMALVDSVATLVSAEGWILDYCKTFDGRPKLPTWEPVELVRAEDSKTKRIAEVTDLALVGLYVLSKKAVEELYDLIKDDVELLPVVVEGEERWVMYVTSVLDCLDYEKSEYTLFSDGSVLSFDGLMFKKDVIAGHNVFRHRDRPRGFIYTSEEFMERVKSIDPDGTKFALVWDSERKTPIDLPMFYRA